MPTTDACPIKTEGGSDGGLSSALFEGGVELRKPVETGLGRLRCQDVAQVGLECAGRGEWEGRGTPTSDGTTRAFRDTEPEHLLVRGSRTPNADVLLEVKRTARR